MDSEMTDQTTRLPVRRALISVSDKTGILEFARELVALNVEILSTGGTYKLLKDNRVFRHAPATRDALLASHSLRGRLECSSYVIDRGGRRINASCIVQDGHV